MFSDEPDEPSPTAFQDEPSEDESFLFQDEGDEHQVKSAPSVGSLFKDEPDELEDHSPQILGAEHDESLGLCYINFCLMVFMCCGVFSCFLVPIQHVILQCRL